MLKQEWVRNSVGVHKTKRLFICIFWLGILLVTESCADSEPNDIEKSVGLTQYFKLISDI